ncbi:MAG: ATP-dependent Clp protease ATP-binding subunit [Treponema sp.]|nr:ATP-dependent Clp protease ATP-binding subunit [Treponema sp.]
MIRGPSPRVQRIISVLAPEEAYNFGSSQLDVEHMVLALLKSADGLGYIVLKALKINVLMLQTTIEQSMPARISNTALYDLPRSARLSALMEVAGVEARITRSDYIGTEHILLAAIREEKSIVKTFFERAGITLDQARQCAMEIQKKVPSSAKLDGNSTPYSEPVPTMSDGSSQKKKSADSILQQFSRDLTEIARDSDTDPVVGREQEISRIVQTLSRRSKNNPILVGEPGVGKTAIVEGLAQRIVKGNVPRGLLKKRILCLDLAAMIAGTKYRGDFEERMKRVMKEVKENRDIILFVDEIHTIIGAGGPEGSMEASNMIKPALSRGEIQIIGATTLKEYRNRLERDTALTRRFQMIMINEPSDAETEQMLEGLKTKFEDFHHVRYDDDVIKAAVKYSRRYIQERCLPDKAIDVLDEAGAAKKIQNEQRPVELEQLEKTIDELIEEKRNLVQEQDYEQAAYVRDKVSHLRKQLDEYNTALRAQDARVRTRVTVEDICSVISGMTGIPVEKLDADESKKLLHMEDTLKKDVIGQDQAISVISSAVRRSRSGVSSLKRPIGSFIFLGPTGVGKTQLAKALAKFLFGNEDALIRFDMSEFSDKYTSSSLIGAPPGYIGHEEGGRLTEKVRQKPYSVVLFDEIEKADPQIFNLLLQIFEEGELSDTQNHTVSFKNTLVILTSNAGVRNINAESKLGFASSKEGILPHDEMEQNAMEELKHIMSPELINRIDDVIVFNALGKKEISSILDIQIRELEERIAEQGLTISVKPKAREYMVEHGYDQLMGARPMRRLIQQEIEDQLATLILSGKGKNSSRVVIECKNDKLKVSFADAGGVKKLTNISDEAHPLKIEGSHPMEYMEQTE